MVALDGYGDWNYSNTYSSYVWSPRVEAGWSPYSDGSWYYTPAGLTWWSNDPWGWYPHHYGNWFFESSWNRWCWTPANVYSPAWVYWAYTPSYVGWCPVGYYTGYSPWWGSYYRHIGWNRSNVYLPVHGTFNTRQVDFRGWNFTGAGRFGSGVGRAEVIRGDRIGDRLGAQVAISSRPIVLPGRGGDTRDAMRNYIREAPRVIERSASADSGRLAPILGRERTLPTATVEALRDRAVVAERGRLAGPAAAEIAPRGVRVGAAASPASRSPPATRSERSEAAPARSKDPRGAIRSRAAAPPSLRPLRRESFPRATPSREAVCRMTGPPPPGSRTALPRGRTRTGGPGVGPSSGTLRARIPLPRPLPGIREPNASNAAAPRRARWSGHARIGTLLLEDWRSRRIQPPAAENPAPRREEARPSDWRSRSEVPPARRVIEGSVPRRDPEGVRERPMPRDERPAYRPGARRPRTPRPRRRLLAWNRVPLLRRRAQSHPPLRRARGSARPPPAKAPERGRKD